LLNSLKLKLINIGKTRNKRKKRFINSKTTKQSLLQNQENIKSKRLETITLEKEIFKTIKEVNEMIEEPYIKTQLTEENYKIC
jgi:hypothetical protein